VVVESLFDSYTTSYSIDAQGLVHWTIYPPSQSGTEGAKSTGVVKKNRDEAIDVKPRESNSPDGLQVTSDILERLSGQYERNLRKKSKSRKKSKQREKRDLRKRSRSTKSV
jgi:hypothetical protein